MLELGTQVHCSRTCWVRVLGSLVVGGFTVASTSASSAAATRAARMRCARRATCFAALGHDHRHRQGHARRGAAPGVRAPGHRHRSRSRAIDSCLRRGVRRRSCGPRVPAYGSGFAAARAARRPPALCAVSRRRGSPSCSARGSRSCCSRVSSGLATVGASLAAVALRRLLARCRSRVGLSCSRAPCAALVDVLRTAAISAHAERAPSRAILAALAWADRSAASEARVSAARTAARCWPTAGSHSGEELARPLRRDARRRVEAASRSSRTGASRSRPCPAVGYRLERADRSPRRGALRSALAPRGGRANRDVSTCSRGARFDESPSARGAAAAARHAACVHRRISDARAAAGAAAAGVAPLGAGLCLSVGWQFADTPAELVGADARGRRGRAPRARASWPASDMRSSGRTISCGTAQARRHPARAHGRGGGRLLRRRRHRHQRGLAAGVAAAAQRLAARRRRSRDMRRRGAPPPRARSRSGSSKDLSELFASYAETGFDAYRDDWRAADYLRAARVGSTKRPARQRHGARHRGRRRAADRDARRARAGA